MIQLMIHWPRLIQTASTPAFNHEAAAVDANYIAAHLTEMILRNVLLPPIFKTMKNRWKPQKTMEREPQK